MMDTYRAGDPDFENVRDRFYGMVERHLSIVAIVLPKGRRTKIADPGPGRDGIPTEIEKYGDPRIASYRDNAADAVQWLVSKGHLNSRIVGVRTDRLLEIAWAEGRARITMMSMLADLFERAELTALKSPDLEGLSGGSFGPRAIHHTKLEAMMVVQRMRSEIPPVCMKMLEAVITRNESPWHGLGRSAQAAVFDAIRRSIDFAAWSLERSRAKPEITDQELVRRWPEALEWITAGRLTVAAISFKRDQPATL